MYSPSLRECGRFRISAQLVGKMADADNLHRTNARLHQELRARDERCKQLQKEKDELAARLESQNLAIESIKEDVRRLQDILQKVIVCGRLLVPMRALAQLYATVMLFGCSDQVAASSSSDHREMLLCKSCS